MFRYSKLLVVLSLVCLAGSPRWGIAEETAKEEHQVFIEVCVAEISLSKLRTLGFDTSALHLDTESAGRTDDGQRDAISTIAALGKDNLVRVISHPRLATMSGRQASIQVGDAIKLEVVPQVGDQRQIQLDYRLELNLSDANAAKERHSTHQLMVDSATELVPGKTCCVSETRSRRTEDGKTHETLTVVLLRADFKAPADIRTAEKLPAVKPIVERRYQEIEIPKRRQRQ
ncbi:MAG TPA: hypothetical protein VFB96_15260 [Pirellulaceae bacterium]|nr:hypothetical protein [Pirellulaceae bacterium]